MVSPDKNVFPRAPLRRGDALLDVLAAGAMAWAAPGLGHCLTGHRRHGAVIGAVVGILWLVGLGVGGFSAVDARPAPAGQRAWFWAQAGVGASVLVERAHASMRAGGNPPALALGRGREVATMYLAAAGLLNMMAVADAMLRASKPRPKAQAEPQSVPGEAP